MIYTSIKHGPLEVNMAKEDYTGNYDYKLQQRDAV